MSLFLDTGDIEEIKRYMDMGIIRGVTCNPTILKKSGIIGDLDSIKDKIIEIGEATYPYPTSVEVTSNNEKVMEYQILTIINLMEENGQVSFNVKIPIHGSNGESNLKFINLWSGHIDINVTAMMNAQQCFLAALAGAKYLSLFGGRIADSGGNCIEEIKKMRILLDNYQLESQIIVGSVRETANVIDWLIAGSHIVTVPPDILNKMIVHSRTKETVKEFLEDAKRQESTYR